MKGKFDRNKFKRVIFVSTRYKWDGLNPKDMAIILCGEHWLNQSKDCYVYQFLEEYAALVTVINDARSVSEALKCRDEQTLV
ncbi:hypothetical protein GK047_07930 [Paenibacillus sp. SYP-B3998]|uniref:Uncharacterized protein n=2 Tax=Paenibacillus sp. SYP-B3998 TaxID=2678564 RepID=A0A6G3ZWZ7_9BACL|nr:hypothetical protein [Paenibacillus sp. SYP-B3998]